MAFQSRQYGSKQVSKAHNRTALMQVIAYRENLDNISAESLARSYGMPVPEVAQLIENEKHKRAGR